jgi:hypothetical protein
MKLFYKNKVLNGGGEGDGEGDGKSNMTYYIIAGVVGVIGLSIIIYFIYNSYQTTTTSAPKQITTSVPKPITPLLIPTASTASTSSTTTPISTASTTTPISTASTTTPISTVSTILSYPPSRLSTTSYTTTISNNKYGNGDYVVSASVERGGAYTANNAFLSKDVFWQINPYPTNTNTMVNNVNINGEWVQIKLPNPIILDSYRHYCGPTNIPIQWQLVGSNDGSVWTYLHKQTIPVSYYTTISNNISPIPIAYKYYRFIYIASEGMYPVLQGLTLYSATKI